MGCKKPQNYQCNIASFRKFTGLLLLILFVVVADAVTGSMNDQKILDIRSSIVQALGIQRIPDPTKANVSQAEYERAHKEYLTRLRRSTEGDHRQRKLFTMHAHGEETAEGIVLNFPINIDNSENAVVESALLRLLLEHDEDSSAAHIEIRIYRLRTFDSRRRRLISRRTVRDPDSVRLRWLDFDLSDEVAAVTTLDSKNPIQLLVQLLRKDYQKDNVMPARGFSISSSALNIHTLYPTDDFDLNDDEDFPKRLKRSLSARDRLMSLHRGRRTECHGEAKKCCRHRMTVSFKDLDGFDFIIQPKSFDAGYCKGRCPPRYNPAHHHALLQSLIWKEDRKKAPRPCCAPSKLAELEILYFDENDTTKLKVSNWKDMRVLECACS